MELGDYIKSAVVSVSGFVLFFMGTLLPIMEGFELIPIFAIFLLISVVSFYNKSPLGGFFYGLFTSIVFLTGNLLTVVFEEYFVILNEVITDQGFLLFLNLISTFIPELISFVIGFASLGLFFGLLGYIFHLASPETILNPPLYYRDYWSSIHSLGKSIKREYSDLDRRFRTSSVNPRGIWNRIVTNIKLPTPDVAFITNEKQKKLTNENTGQLYDLSSGKLLGKNLVNPEDLISKYRPFILKVPEISTNTKGVRRLVYEKLLENFLGKVLDLKIILAIFGALSTIFVFLVHINQGSGAISNVSRDLPTIIAICFSAVILIFVWRWSVKSQELFKQKPDETILILVVYVVLGILYGFFYRIIFNFPANTAGWVLAWFDWTFWFLFLSAVLGLGYILFHREVEVVNTYFYDNSKIESKLGKSPMYKDFADEPFWLKRDKIKSFWVIRFMYYWRYELAKVPHPDWERIELWFDAEKGTLKWFVSDYHYRELWYEVKDYISTIYVSFFLNFHTPIPILNQQEINAITESLNKDNMTLLRNFINGESKEIIEKIEQIMTKDFWAQLHPAEWISKFGLQNIAAEFSSKIPWRFWRYPFGLEKPETYFDKPATLPKDQPISNQKLEG